MPLLIAYSDVLALKDIKFVYGEPAMIAKAGGSEYLVIGDLHIGMEIRLSRNKGVHLFSATEKMAERIKAIMDSFSLGRIILLGDVKDSILYPEIAEIRLLKRFFDLLGEFEIQIVAGNHDAHLAEILDRKVERELEVGRFGFTHGNRKPSARLMKLDYLVSAHDHVTVRKVEKGVTKEQKAWAIYRLNSKIVGSTYGEFNRRIKLISMPAFNDLIMGTSISAVEKSGLNPLVQNGTFRYNDVKVYSLSGKELKLD